MNDCKEDSTYRIVWLAGLAECLGCGVDLFDHLCEVLVQLVEAILQLLGELVSPLTLLVGASQTIRPAGDTVHLHQILDLLLVAVEVRVELLLVLLHHGQLPLDLSSIALSLEGLGVQLTDLVRVLDQRSVPLCNRLGLGLELLLVLGQVSGPSCDDLVH